MPPHSCNTHSVSQPCYAPDFSFIMAKYEVTPSYASPAPVPHIHKLNFLEPMCNVQTVVFVAPLAALSYYQPPVQPTYVLAMNTLVPQG